MHPQTLRLYEARGLVRPRRTPGGTRLYSDHDLARLERIQRLSGELGLSLVGHRARARARGHGLDARATRVERLERELDAPRRASSADVAAVRASYRREVVVWEPPSQALERQRSN